MIQNAKICLECKIEKNINYFSPQGKYYAPRCRECCRNIAEIKRRESGIKPNKRQIENGKAICSKCKIEKSIDNFRLRRRKKKLNLFLNSECKKCESDRDKLRIRSPESIARKKITSKIWIEQNKDSYLEERRIYSKERSKKYPQFHKRWRDNNKVKMANYSRSASKYARENLLDYYIVGYLVQSTNLTTEQVRQQPELIELTRKIIQIKRKIENDKSNELSATC